MEEYVLQPPLEEGGLRPFVRGSVGDMCSSELWSCPIAFVERFVSNVIGQSSLRH